MHGGSPYPPSLDLPHLIAIRHWLDFRLSHALDALDCFGIVADGFAQREGRADDKQRPHRKKALDPQVNRRVINAEKHCAGGDNK